MRTHQTMSRGAVLATGSLVVVGVVAGLAALHVYNSGVRANTPEFEFYKALLTIVSVAVVGGFSAYVFSSLQKDRDRRVEERRRLDEQIIAVLNKTLEHWVAVKQIRRELEALTRTDSNSYQAQAMISVRDYDHYLRKLSEHQLAFESLKKSSATLEEKLSPVTSKADSLSALYSTLEEFLNSIVDEYQVYRFVVVQRDGKISINDLAELSAKREAKNGRMPRSLYQFIFETKVFREEAGKSVDLVVRRLERSLREPP